MKKCTIFIVSIFILPVMILTGTIIQADVPIELYGITVENPKPVFTVQGIFDGSFQENFDNWYKDSHPLRTLLVKIHNQMTYNMNSCLFSGDIVLGKDGWLYTKEYISCSFEEISDDTKLKYDEYVKKLRLLQDNLEASGKQFIYLISPSKVEVYPEFLPNRFQMIRRNRNKIRNNYDYLLERMKEENINYVDAKTILLDEADGILTFAKTGIHWNYYAAAICARNMLRKLGVGADIRVELVTKDSPFGAEQDIYALSNIFKGIVDKEYFGGTLICDSVSERNSKKVLEMGTSFSVELADIFCADNNFIWDEMIRYQYFVAKTIYHNGMPAQGQPENEINEEQLKKEIISADIIFIENNDSYIPDSHFEFVDEALKLSIEELGSASGRQ